LLSYGFSDREQSIEIEEISVDVQVQGIAFASMLCSTQPNIRMVSAVKIED
jgi:hypothetical protein